VERIPEPEKDAQRETPVLKPLVKRMVRSAPFYALKRGSYPLIHRSHCPELEGRPLEELESFTSLDEANKKVLCGLCFSSIEGTQNKGSGLVRTETYPPYSPVRNSEPEKVIVSRRVERPRYEVNTFPQYGPSRELIVTQPFWPYTERYIHPQFIQPVPPPMYIPGPYMQPGVDPTTQLLTSMAIGFTSAILSGLAGY
jgi:hypothetical protein